MKKAAYRLLLLLLTAMSISSCEKEEINLNAGAKVPIIFDDNVDKVAADYKVGSMLTLKISAPGATSVSIRTTYGTGTVRARDLGSFPVQGGVATVVIPANSLRAAADGVPIGAGAAPASSRAANTYSLAVEATTGTVTERRNFTAVLVQ